MRLFKTKFARWNVRPSVCLVFFGTLWGSFASLPPPNALLSRPNRMRLKTVISGFILKREKKFWPRKIGQITETTNNRKMQQTILVTSIMKKPDEESDPYVIVYVCHLLVVFSFHRFSIHLIFILSWIFKKVNWSRRFINGLQWEIKTR